MLVVGAAFTTLGGLLGALMFKKDPPPHSGPPPPLLAAPAAGAAGSTATSHLNLVPGRQARHRIGGRRHFAASAG